MDAANAYSICLATDEDTDELRAVAERNVRRPPLYGDVLDGGGVLRMNTARVAAIPFFADLPEAELAAVAKVAFEVEVPSGQALTRPGGIGHVLFAVEDGTADVVISGATVATIGTGDVVGEIAVLADPPDPFAPPELAEGGERTASVVATSPMRTIAVYKRDVWELERQAPIATQRLRAKREERRAANDRRDLGDERESPAPDAL